ncbi:MAG TPA: hypothetical protein VE932_19550 [Patescibacteria group bacterium]|nr:hypothetical protein [Patescibacteria group bacterium]
MSVRLGRTAALAALLVLVSGRAFAVETTTIVRSGETRLQATVGRRTVQASIKTLVKKAKLYPGETDATAPERSTVEQVEISVDGKRVFVPGSVAYRLVIPLEASLRVVSRISVLTINGGDASESYVVKIEFDSKRVRRKIVASRAMPDRPTEITTYYMPVLEDK